ncbi:MAG: YggT family protein [Anaerolineae bacterium]|jgi:YggT family protein|nr:YggT family protein [Anaerolineae bacterium]MBL8106937.1 YggT family protein [Anaerolineales bacterium]MCC7188038.1 YggT family protein [Anaerolineales bacterium]HQU36581.1 YggT family protein [Anaerolineales bacterium]
MDTLIDIVELLSQLLTLLIFVSVILSYVMDPYHPVRRGIDNIIEPMLMPIRRVVPAAGMFDFSPMILMLLIQFASRFIVAILTSLR